MTQCPPVSYPAPEGEVCLACPLECASCTSAFACTSCTKTFYRTGDFCVLGRNCPAGTYPDELSQECRKCSPQCFTCYGASSRDCTVCNFEEGYERSEAGEECKEISCADGMYLSIDRVRQLAECLECNEACDSCRGGSHEDCVGCSKGFAVLGTKEGSLVCGKCPLGFVVGENGNCREVCGDGINMGQFECDDGNNVNGDGCSAECTIEKGFKCSSRGTERSVCVDIIPPKAYLSVRRGNLLLISFDETVVIKGTSAMLESAMDVSLRGNCKLTWELASTFPINKALSKLEVRTYPGCSLKAAEDEFVVQFLDTSLIVDRDRNELASAVITAKSARYVYTSGTEQAYSEGIGNAFSSSSMVTLGLMVFITLFQSASVGAFWSFVDMVQLISYLPALSCEVPSNLKAFLTDYLNVKKLVIPLDMLPEFKFNPLSYASEFLLDPLNNQFSLAGYESLSFVFNFLEELTTWVLLFFLYLLLTFLCSFTSKSK